MRQRKLFKVLSYSSHHQRPCSRRCCRRQNLLSLFCQAPSLPTLSTSTLKMCLSFNLWSIIPLRTDISANRLAYKGYKTSFTPESKISTLRWHVWAVERYYEKSQKLFPLLHLTQGPAPPKFLLYTVVKGKCGQQIRRFKLTPLSPQRIFIHQILSYTSTRFCILQVHRVGGYGANCLLRF